MSDQIRWGIIGAGGIAKTFAKALDGSECGRRYAVGSRNQDKASAFADEHGFEKAYGSYEDLLGDSSVDAVYIATPHPVHREPAIAAAKAEKHILCEKPMGVTAAECEEMIAAAEDSDVVLLEAFMYRTHPQTLRVQELIADGSIGEVRTVRSCFCYGLGPDYNVRTDKSLRGGGLYDVGCYCINFSRMVAGEEPDRTKAVWTLGAESGVDEILAAVLHFPSGVIAHFDVGIRTAGGASAEILGSDGTISVPQPWKPDAERAVIRLTRKGKPAEEIVIESGGNPYTLEADHLAAVVTGEAEPLIPAQNAVGNAAVMDEIWRGMHQ